MIKKIFCIFAMLFIVAGAAAAQAQTDSVFIRAQRMVSDGNAAAGRGIVDSMIRTARRGSPAYAEALFWRATLASTVKQSEQDYRRLIIEFPLFARTGDVLLRLAQLELLRGNRDAAVVHLRRIQSEHPEFGNQAAASYWLSRALFEKNNFPAGCAAVADAKRLVKEDDIELKNQIDYQDQQCAGVVPGAAVDSASARDTLPASSPALAPAPVPDAAKPAANERTTSEAGSYSLQVAAYNKKPEATALAAQLTKRGFSARVDGASAPFRVRIGRYRTRADAVAAQQRARKSGISGFVVKAE